MPILTHMITSLQPTHYLCICSVEIKEMLKEAEGYLSRASPRYIVPIMPASDREVADAIFNIFDMTWQGTVRNQIG